jgi:hypothetical protein
VKRHERGLHAKARGQQGKRGAGDRRVGVRQFGDPTGGEGSGRGAGVAGRPEHEHGTREHRDAAAERVREVLPAGGAGLGGLVVCDQRVGRHREQFIKDKEDDQVRGEGDPDRRREAPRKRREVPRLCVLVESAHVTDAVETRHQPQQAREQPEQDAKRVGSEREPHAGNERPEVGDVHLSLEDAGNHAGDEAEFRHRREDGPGLPEVRATARGEDRGDRDGGDEYCGERSEGRDVGHGVRRVSIVGSRSCP